MDSRYAAWIAYAFSLHFPEAKVLGTVWDQSTCVVTLFLDPSDIPPHDIVEKWRYQTTFAQVIVRPASIEDTNYERQYIPPFTPGELGAAIGWWPNSGHLNTWVADSLPIGSSFEIVEPKAGNVEFHLAANIAPEAVAEFREQVNSQGFPIKVRVVVAPLRRPTVQPSAPTGLDRERLEARELWEQNRRLLFLGTRDLRQTFLPSNWNNESARCIVNPALGPTDIRGLLYLFDEILLTVPPRPNERWLQYVGLKNQDVGLLCNAGRLRLIAPDLISDWQPSFLDRAAETPGAVLSARRLEALGLTSCLKRYPALGFGERIRDQVLTLRDLERETSAIDGTPQEMAVRLLTVFRDFWADAPRQSHAVPGASWAHLLFARFLPDPLMWLALPTVAIASALNAHVVCAPQYQSLVTPLVGLFDTPIFSSAVSDGVVSVVASGVLKEASGLDVRRAATTSTATSKALRQFLAKLTLDHQDRNDAATQYLQTVASEFETRGLPADRSSIKVLGTIATSLTETQTAALIVAVLGSVGLAVPSHIGAQSAFGVIPALIVGFGVSRTRQSLSPAFLARLLSSIHRTDPGRILLTQIRNSTYKD